MEDQDHFQQPTKMQPSEEASFCSKLFFCWAPPLFYKTYRKKVAEEYYTPMKSHKSELLGNKLENAWKKECDLNRNPNLWRVLWKIFYLEFTALAFLFFFIEFIIKLSQPWLIGKLMKLHVTGETLSQQYYIYGSLIALANFFSVILGHFYQLKIQHLGMKIRVGCCSLIYRRILSTNGAVATKIGKIINLLSNDVGRFDMAAMFFLQLVVAPVETATIIYFMYITVGPTSIAGIVLLLVFIPTQIFLGRLTTSFRKKTAKKTDQRIQLMDEILLGIQVIKVFAWETLFTNKISQARKAEIRQIMKTSLVRAFNSSSMLFLNRTGIFLCIISYALTHHEVNAEYVFVVSSFYAILRQTMTVYFPLGIQNFQETKVSVGRITDFLLSTETKTKDQTEEEQPLLLNQSSKTDPKNPGIYLKNASVKWTDSAKHVFENLDLEVSGKELAVITGPVGSGKSTLLYTLLQELPLTGGHISVVGNISYASQEPWLFSGTIRQNILFGSKFEEQKYKKIVKICQLEKDFSALPESDGSPVGEAGSLLSGGQKTRISLARALYKDADIYLLDDPLAAVDTKVAQKIFQECILQYLQDKCRVLVTHRLSHLVGTSHKRYVLDKGMLRSENTEKFDYVENEDRDYVDSIVSNTKTQPQNTPSVPNSSGAFRKYIQSGGSYSSVIALFLLFLLTQAAASGADYFVAFWSNLKVENIESFKLCLYIYVAIISATVILSVTRSIFFFHRSMTSSKNLHNDMFKRIIKAPMLFFKTTSTGQISNRFSKDLGLIDETLPSLLMDSFQIGFIVLGSVILILIVNPWLLIPTAAFSGLFYLFKTRFLARSRNMKRLEAEARSPIYAHTRATVQGLATIRTFGVETNLRHEFDQQQDLHSSAFYMFMICNRAYGFWLDMSCVFYTAAVIITVMMMNITAGNIGLSVTQSINLIGVLQWGIRQWSESENQLVNVERIIEYTQLPQEHDSKQESPKNWPNKGEIKFDSVYLDYSQKHRALNNVNLTVNPKEKIGVVGRTGAGKTSLTSTLFRLYDTKGTICIDGVNINDIPLKTLRSKLSIIPQEPVLFTGPLRETFDPFNEFDDDAIWQVLEQVQLKEVISKLPQNISSEVLKGGSNFSVGQRQLICMARALLRKNKIIVMDEATANIDSETEACIHESLKNNFHDCTIILVAHRLNAIMRLDKVVVMEDGRIHDYGSPESLLQNAESMFSELVRENKRIGSK